jgi:hypothetical protein
VSRAPSSPASTRPAPRAAPASSQRPAPRTAPTTAQRTAVAAVVASRAPRPKAPSVPHPSAKVMIAAHVLHRRRIVRRSKAAIAPTRPTPRSGPSTPASGAPSRPRPTPQGGARPTSSPTPSPSRPAPHSGTIGLGQSAGPGGRRGLSKRGKTLSKAQQKLMFAQHVAGAHEAARSGAAFKALPEHVK